MSMKQWCQWNAHVIKWRISYICGKSLIKFGKRVNNAAGKTGSRLLYKTASFCVNMALDINSWRRSELKWEKEFLDSLG